MIHAAATFRIVTQACCDYIGLVTEARPHSLKAFVRTVCCESSSTLSAFLGGIRPALMFFSVLFAWGVLWNAEWWSGKNDGRQFRRWAWLPILLAGIVLFENIRGALWLTNLLRAADALSIVQQNDIYWRTFKGCVQVLVYGCLLAGIQYSIGRVRSKI